MSHNIIELRAEPWHACSVLSEVFAASRHETKYIGSGIVADISESGLSITMDAAPSGDVLIIRNSYFEAASKVRNTTPLANGGFRVGVAFTSAVAWKQHLSPTGKSSSTPPIKRASSENRQPGSGD